MKIAIFGLARSGVSVLKYLVKNNDKYDIYLVNQGKPQTWSVYDLIQKHNIKAYDQKDATEILGDVDQIIISPGISPKVECLNLAHKKNVEIISEIEFTYRLSSVPVVAITGTNGKTTTTTMIEKFLNENGKKAFVGGNIGNPYSTILLDKSNYDVAIIELSSFQLEGISKFHPQISIILNITKNHMERYDSFDDYKSAKFKICMNQTENDIAIIASDLAINTKANVIRIESLKDFSFETSMLVGAHNKINFFCAHTVAKALGVEDLQSKFQDFIDKFTGVEFRLEYIRNFNGLKIYNDAKSTNFDATAAAIDAFENEDLYLILGGKLRSNSIDIEIIKSKNVKFYFVFGEAKEILFEELKGKKVKCFERIEDIITLISANKFSGVLLFSPAFPSFDQFKDYVQRGNTFTNIVNKL